ncbi:hypothetical protein [Mucilaginibacter psychrotolerans]|uniref:Uncharacterized protein n=1 Tax=Mucilaginibacter psychrotolerans TaxID=1524096 RepID=A0A4Y8SC51_9SPHI|nr:hypothetical protein [Mucilaginibacter psychrotolerans]TFF36548.1 hypothetical protein E2R66_15450 [Mucilaginibacter psychrotolerans]
MSCNLKLGGTDFNVDAFIEKSGLTVYDIHRHGEPVFKFKPDGRKHDGSGCAAAVSDAKFNDFNEQVNDAIGYLEHNGETLKHISTAEGLDYAFLHFGVSFNPGNGFYQSHRLPPELVKLAAEVNIGITISMYPPSQEE